MQFFHALIEHLGAASLVIMLHSELARAFGEDRWLTKFMSGAFFGIAIVFSMHEPMIVLPGIIVDARHVLTGLASFLAGPIGALVTLLLGISFRLTQGGAGALAGVVGLVTTATVGLYLRARTRQRSSGLTLRDILWLGICINLSVTSVFVLPFDTALYLLHTGAPVIIASNILGCLVVGSMLVREQRRIQLEAVDRELSQSDELTGLANRRSFNRSLATQLEGAGLSGLPLSLLLVDVDNFKLINDTHGHGQGDRTLCHLSDLIRNVVRHGDLVARLGGDEFAVILPHTEIAGASLVADRILDDVRRRRSPPLAPGYTVSIGIASTEQGFRSVDYLMSGADAALYSTKENGRDGFTKAAPLISLAKAA